MLSLFVRRRRVWVRASDDGGGRTVVEVAGLAAPRARTATARSEEVDAGSAAEQPAADAAAELRPTTARRQVSASESLAHLSNNLLYSAMAVYAGAMFCFAADLAFAPRVAERRRRRQRCGARGRSPYGAGRAGGAPSPGRAAGVAGGAAGRAEPGRRASRSR